MESNERGGVNWPELVVLACVLVLGITIPLSWHRRHDRDGIVPIERPAITTNFNADLAAPTLDEPPSELATIVVPDEPVDGLQPVAPSQTPIPGSAFATLVENDSVGGMNAIGPEKLRRRPAHHYRRDTRQFDQAPLFGKHAWPWPEAIQARFAILEKHESMQTWCEDTRRLMDLLTQLTDIQHQEVPGILDGLRAAAAHLQSLAGTMEDHALSYEMNAMAYDVLRRVDVWTAAHNLATASTNVVSGPVTPFIDATYLRTRPTGSINADVINVSSLLADLEQYEYTRLGSDGVNIAEAIQQLAASTNPDQHQLAEQLDEHYRNANLRIAASGELFNRMLPGPQEETGRINQRILGVPVWGNQWTKTRLYVRLIPDSRRIRIGMEAWGSVCSDTTAASGPVYLHNEGQTAFLVRKLILVDNDGVKAKRTVAEAVSESELTGIDTDYDGGLLGPIVRALALKKAGEQQGDALSETEQQVATMARRKFDEQIAPRLKEAIDNFYYEVWQPMQKLGLEPMTVSTTTTEKRAIGRLRVGSATQLAAHTARPRAFSNSLISMQLHESAMNNALAQFDLDGQSLTLHDLYLRISEKLDQPVTEVPETMPKNVVITFAPRDAVRVRCQDGAIKLTMGLTSITKGAKHKWSNLIVRADYGIEVDGMQANLVRSGSIELKGKRLRTRDQITLRGVFSKLLSRSNRLKMVPDKLVSDPRLASLEVTQRFIDDGWIGIAIGPSPEKNSLDQAARVEDPARW